MSGCAQAVSERVAKRCWAASAVVFGHVDLVVGCGFVGLEPVGQPLGVVEDLLDGTRPHDHLVKCGRAGMACTTNSMPSSDVTRPTSTRRPDLSPPISMTRSSPCNNPHAVVVCVEHVIVIDPVSACAGQDDGIHEVKMPDARGCPTLCQHRTRRPAARH